MLGLVASLPAGKLPFWRACVCAKPQRQRLLTEHVWCAHMHACRALFATGESFPLASAFAFSVYKFQQKRVKAEPDGPYFGGNPIVGALLSTVINLALACGVRAGRMHDRSLPAASCTGWVPMPQEREKGAGHGT